MAHNYYLALGLDPHKEWDKAAFDAALARAIREWDDLQHQQTPAGEAAEALLRQRDAIRTAMYDPAQRAAQRAEAIRLLGQDANRSQAPNAAPSLQTSGQLPAMWLCGRDHPNATSTAICTTDVDGSPCDETRSVLCPACQVQNDADARACRQCGRDLTARIVADDAVRRALRLMGTGQLPQAQQALEVALTTWDAAVTDRVTRARVAAQQRLDALRAAASAQRAPVTGPVIGGNDPPVPEKTSNTQSSGPAKPLNGDDPPDPPPLDHSPKPPVQPQKPPSVQPPPPPTGTLRLAPESNNGNPRIVFEWEAAPGVGVQYRVRALPGMQPPRTSTEGVSLRDAQGNEILTGTTFIYVLPKDFCFGTPHSFAVFAVGITTPPHAVTAKPLTLYRDLPSLLKQALDGMARVYSLDALQGVTSYRISRRVKDPSQSKDPNAAQERVRYEGPKADFTDGQLENGVTYVYRVQCVYADGYVTTGREIDVTPHAAPVQWKVYAKPQVQPDGTFEIEITWDPIMPGAEVRITRVNVTDQWPAHLDFIKLDPRALKPNKGTSHTDRTRHNGVLYYRAFQIIDGIAYVSTNAAEARCLSDIADLDAIDMGNTVFLRWHWGMGAREVHVFYRHDEQPATSTSFHDHWKVTQQEYDEIGCFGIPHQQQTAGDVRHSILVAVPYESSPGVYAYSAGQQVVLGRRWVISYRFDRGRLILRWHAAPNTSAIPLPAVEVHTQRNSQPLLRTPRPLMQIPGFDIAPERDYVYPLPPFDGDGDVFGRVFFVDPTYNRYVSLIPREDYSPNIRRSLQLH